MITIAITEDFCAHLAGIIIPSVPFRREQIPSLGGCWVLLLLMAIAASGAEQPEQWL